MQTSGASRREIANAYSVVIVREGGRSSIPEASVMKSISRSVLDTPHAPATSLRRRIGGAVKGEQSGIYAKTLSFFGASRACSIDFGQFAPMFRPDAARYRNAIS
jgi:hypothetical protein